MGIEAFMEPAIAGRVNEILVMHREKNRKDYDHLQEMLEQMEPDVKRTVEKYLERCSLWNSEELFAVYEQAFFDGLNVAHKAFNK